jgi:23S rRNA (uracil1939-C5)-methyltransferase
MLARHDGRVVLVAGAIPGERVRAVVERSARGLTWARTVEIVEPSAARRPMPGDPACGGMDYAHIRYDDQLRLKAEVIADAFRRRGKVTLDARVPVARSSEHGYRLRSHFHVRQGRAGFLREGTHELCDAGATRQVLQETVDAVQALIGSLGSDAATLDGITVAESVSGSQRVLHVDGDDSGWTRNRPLPPPDASVTGVTRRRGGAVVALFGSPTVVDTAADVFGIESPIPPATAWTRHATPFFQGNRHLIGPLLGRVIALTPGRRVADLYAGVGLFAIALAARGQTVVAVEGDRFSGRDLELNAKAAGSRVTVLRSAVEDAMPALRSRSFDAVIVDPPRTGVSARALRAICDAGWPEIVYISCDPATLARDASILLRAGYGMVSIEAFDLFPNTGHVETVVEFRRTPRTPGRPRA